MFPNRVPMDRDTPSPSHWSIYSLIHSCMSPGVPKKESSYIWEKHKVTIHGAPCRRKAYIQWGAAWFSKGIVNDTAISTPVPCSLRHDTFHLCSHVNHCCVGCRNILLKPQVTQFGGSFWATNSLIISV